MLRKFTESNLKIRFEQLQLLTATNSCLTNREVASTLNLSTRQVQRLKKIFDGSYASLKHKNKGILKDKLLSQKKQQEVLEAVRFWNHKLKTKDKPPLQYSHALDRINHYLHLHLNRTYFVNLMLQNNIYSSHGRPKINANKIHLENPKNNKNHGQEFQADGTFGIALDNSGITYCAHVIVDAGSNEIVSIFLDTQETTYGYLNAFKLAFEKHGIPQTIVTDKRNSFWSNNIQESTQTVLGKIFSSLDIELICDSNPRRKNKVESKNHVVKTRIIKELTLAKNTLTLDSTNSLLPQIILQTNQNLHNKIDPNKNNLRPLPTNYNFDLNFAIKKKRTISATNTISIDNVSYIPLTCTNKVFFLNKGTAVIAYENYKNEQFILYRNQQYRLLRTDSEQVAHIKIEGKNKIQRVITKTGYTISWRHIDYHFLDSNQNPVKFIPKTVVDLYYTRENVTFKPTAAFINNERYTVIPGLPKLKSPTYEHKIAYSFKNRIKIKKYSYHLLDINETVLNIEDNSKISIEIRNNIPTYAILANKRYELYNITINHVS